MAKLKITAVAKRNSIAKRKNVPSAIEVEEEMGVGQAEQRIYALLSRFTWDNQNDILLSVLGVLLSDRNTEMQASYES